MDESPPVERPEPELLIWQEATINTTGRRYVPVHDLIRAIDKIAMRPRESRFAGAAGYLSALADSIETSIKEGKQIDLEWITIVTARLREIAGDLLDLP